jgi:hypothetical protein
MVLDNPHEWKGYEVRYLYTTPPAAQPAPVQEPDAFDDDIEVTGPTTIRTRYRLEVGTKLYTTPPAAQPILCTWTKSNDPSMPDTFDSNCGVVWTFTDGGPGENNVRFCPGCGGKLVEGQS